MKKKCIYTQVNGFHIGEVHQENFSEAKYYKNKQMQYVFKINNRWYATTPTPFKTEAY